MNLGSSHRDQGTSFGYSVPAGILEPRRRQLSVAHRMLDVAMPEVNLQRTRIMTLISKRVPANVFEHMWVGLEPRLRCLSSPFDHGGQGGVFVSR